MPTITRSSSTEPADKLKQLSPASDDDFDFDHGSGGKEEDKAGSDSESECPPPQVPRTVSKTVITSKLGFCGRDRADAPLQPAAHRPRRGPAPAAAARAPARAPAPAKGASGQVKPNSELFLAIMGAVVVLAVCGGAYSYLQRGNKAEAIAAHVVFKTLPNADHEVSARLVEFFKADEDLARLSSPVSLRPFAVTVMATALHERDVATAALRLSGILSRVGIRNTTWTYAAVEEYDVRTHGGKYGITSLAEGLQALLYDAAVDAAAAAVGGGSTGRVWVVDADCFAPGELGFLARVLKEGRIAHPTVPGKPVFVRDFALLLRTAVGANRVVSFMEVAHIPGSRDQLLQARSIAHRALDEAEWDIGIRQYAPLVLALR